MKTNSIHFIHTGGTIDSYYDMARDCVIPFPHSILPNYLGGLKIPRPMVFTEVCMKDSRDLTLDDMQRVCEVIENAQEQLFIITHGAYCIPDTARYLLTNLDPKGRTIVFTGALVPLEFGARSDAAFNLGYCLAAIDHLPSGIHVCMNGALYDPSEIAHLIGEGRFVSVFSKRAM